MALPLDFRRDFLQEQRMVRMDKSQTLKSWKTSDYILAPDKSPHRRRDKFGWRSGHNPAWSCNRFIRLIYKRRSSGLCRDWSSCVFQEKYYRVHMLVRVTSNVLQPSVSDFDRSAWPNLVCTSFIPNQNGATAFAPYIPFVLEISIWQSCPVLG